jgi:RimJ/RimL family protein N-acetyltransferase
MTPIPTLETERLILRPWREADHAPYARLMSDAATARYIGGVLSADDAWRKMASIIGHWQLRGYGSWALEAKANGAFVGYVGPWFPHGFPEPEIGWSLLPEYHGRGFATEAARSARDYAYRVFGWTTAISIVADGNISSERVAARLGAVRERTLEIRGMSAGIWRHPPPDELH